MASASYVTGSHAMKFGITDLLGRELADASRPPPTSTR